MTKLIFGLGNPPKKYQETRHNLGFKVITQFSKKNDFPNWGKNNNANCLYTKKMIANKEIKLVKPLTFMNNSGKTVKYITKKYNLKSENIITIHDDIDLLLGRIRISVDRGAGGHKGIQSIIDELGTKNFVRFRIGICPKTGKPKNPEKFVLQKFNKEEEKIVKEIIKKTISAIEFALKNGLEKAMNIYNGGRKDKK